MAGGEAASWRAFGRDGYVVRLRRSMRMGRMRQVAGVTGLMLLAAALPARAQVDQVDFTITNTAPELNVTADHLAIAGAQAGQPVTAQMTIDLQVIDEGSDQRLKVEVKTPKLIQVSDGAKTYDVAVAMSDPNGTTILDLATDPNWSFATMIGVPSPGAAHHLELDLSAGPFTVLDPAGQYTGPIMITITATNLDP